MRHPWYVIASAVVLGISSIGFLIWKMIVYPLLTLGVLGGIILFIALITILCYWADGGFERE